MLKIKICVISAEREREGERERGRGRERERERGIHRKYRNTENIESQSAEHLWSNYNPSDLKVKSF